MYKLRPILAAALGILCAGIAAADNATEGNSNKTTDKTSCNQTLQLPYQNPSLSAEERAADLCARLTLDEKMSLMMNSSPAIPRLGIPQWDWWSEALHGVGRNGLSTTFPSCIGMASSFNEELIEHIYTAVSDEARAKNTDLRKKGNVGKYQCLSFWTPTINIFRDPRWGRGQESYGEDVYLNSILGQAVVRGLQGTPKYSASPTTESSKSKIQNYVKLMACAKHFAVHSGPEKTRHSLDVNKLSFRDLFETYLPAFKDLVQKSNVSEVMCAYQRFDGEPCCGSGRLLQDILRDDWGFKGIVVSDCGAIADFYRKGRHEVVGTAAEAAAKGVISGTDMECGSVYNNLSKAVEKGLITEDKINQSVQRLLEWRFRLGNFDPDELVEWTKIPVAVVNCQKHKDLALEAARQQTVLLQNKSDILPLSKKDAGKIMVMGPNAADSIMLWGIYYGQPQHTVTILEGINNNLRKAGLKDIAYNQACAMFDMTQRRGLFDKFHTADGRQGMSAKYWDNENMEGLPVAQTVYTSPLTFDGGGDTTFERGVPLFNFSAQFEGFFTANKTETLYLDYKYVTAMRIIVNNDTLHNRYNNDPLRYGTLRLDVKAGEEYRVRIDYRNNSNVANLCFDMARQQEVTMAEIVKAAKDYETIIFVGGISPLYEREETSVTAPGFDKGDRNSIELPQVQRDVLKALHDAGKKIVLVNCSGSAVALTPETETCDAIIQAWYAGEQGGNAIAEVLFGDYNPSGKLPVTFYRDDSQLPAGFDGFENYDMKAHQGRTYRYFEGNPLWAFGHGLSYTTFELDNVRWNKNNACVELQVRNTGKCDGTEIVQVYVKDPSDTEGPIKTLRGHARADVKAGDTANVSIPMPRECFELWDAKVGVMCVKGGKYQLMVGNASDDPKMQTLTIEL